MVKLIKLNEQVKTISGAPIVDILKKDGVMTYRTALISVCELHKPSQPGSGEALKAFDLGMKLLKAKEELQLEKEEAKFLKKIVDETVVYLSVVIGRLSYYLDSVLIDKKVEDKKT